MVLTSYRSDAAIARASRRIWRDEALLVAAINHIFQFMRTCEMQRGERGEITAQILMLLAADTVRNIDLVQNSDTFLLTLCVLFPAVREQRNLHCPGISARVAL
jgi:hypothetical protein